MSGEVTLEQSLAAWINTFEVSTPCSDLTDLADGVSLHEVLINIAPTHFAFDLKKNVGENWLLKMSNLKSLSRGLESFYKENHTPWQGFDVNKIAREANLDEITKLVEIVMECAILSENKQEYIQRMMSLDQSVLAQLMPILSEINSRLGGDEPGDVDSPTTPQMPPQTPGGSDILHAEIHAARRQAESLQQQLEASQRDLQSARADKEAADEKLAEMQRTLRDMQSQQKSSREVEEIRGTYEMEIGAKDRTINELRLQSEELKSKADQLAALKDELEIVREKASQVPRLEGQLAKLKKSTESASDTVQQMRDLQEANELLVKEKLQLEEDAKRVSVLEKQVAQYKQQTQTAERRVTELTADKAAAERDASRLREEVSRLSQDGAQQRAQLEEARAQLQRLGDHTDAAQSPDQHQSHMQEIVPPRVTERLMRLESENERLRASVEGNSAEEITILTSQLDDARSAKQQYESDYIEARAKLGDVERELNDVRERLRALEAEKLNMRGQATVSIERLAASEEAERRQTEALTAANAELVELREKVTVGEHAHLLVQNELISVKKQLSLVGKEKQDLAAEVEREAAAAVKAATTALETEVAQLRSRLEQQTAVIQELEQSVANKTSTINVLEASLTGLREENKQHMQDNMEMLRKQDTLREKIDDARDRERQLEKKLADRPSAGDGESEQLLQKVRQLEAENKKNAVSLNRAKHLYSEAMEKIKGLSEHAVKNDSDETSKTVELLRQQVDEKTQQVQEMERILREQREVMVREQRMVATCFYEFALENQQLRTMQSATPPATQHTSWLGRQRKDLKQGATKAV